MRIGWKQGYEIGIPKIDEQHQGLLALINKLMEYQNKKPKDKEIFGALNAMVKYAEDHFSTEEKYMKLTNYPQFVSHEKLHIAFLEKVMFFAEQLERRDPRIFTDLLDFLKTWYQSHIGGSDREYRDYFLAHRALLLKAESQK